MMIKKIIRNLLLVSFLGVFGNLAFAEGESPEIQINDMVEGEGDLADLHSTVVVHYTGWLMDGTKFDSSLDRNSPFQFTIGTGQVIGGWEIGVGGMRVGGKRELIIPPHLAYGERGAGESIPANATLKFEIELLGVIPPAYKISKVTDVAALIEGGAKVIDIRTPKQATDTGVVDGAKVMTAFDEEFGFQQNFVQLFTAYVERDDQVVLIGPEGRAVVSLAHVISSQGGYTNIHAVEEGMTGWIDAGLPTVAPVTDETTAPAE